MSKKALLCPGQGAQTVGMGRDLAEQYPECRALYEQASDILGYDLGALCFEGPAEALTASDHAQPAIFVTSVAAYRALMLAKPDMRFDVMAGLSSGEWTALHLAGVVAYEDVLRVLAARGKFMQEACLEQKGGMLSVIGMARDTLEEIAANTGVELANFNSPQQIVLSGPVDHIEKATEEVKAAGAKRAIPLKVAGAFHSSLMNSAAERLKAVLDDVVFQKPTLPVLSNVTGRPHETPDTIRAHMVAQVNSSVEWAASIAWMQELGIDTFVECGPGRVLTGLVKRIDKQASLLNIQGVNDLNTLNDD